MQSGYNAHSFTDADRRKRIYIRMLVRCPPTWRLATVAKEVGQLIGFVQRVYRVYAEVARVLSIRYTCRVFVTLGCYEYKPGCDLGMRIPLLVVLSAVVRSDSSYVSTRLYITSRFLHLQPNQTEIICMHIVTQQMYRHLRPLEKVLFDRLSFLSKRSYLIRLPQDLL